jgi:hypothetical protein
MAKDKDPHAIARLLLKLQHKIAADLTKIEDCKEALRGISEERKAGFTEEVEGLGSVEVKAGREAKCKGESPRLNIQKYLALEMSEKRRLLQREVIFMEQSWSKAARLSVTVRL